MVTVMRDRLAGVGAVLLLTACGVAATVQPLSPKAKMVEIGKADPPAGSSLIGPIEAEHGSGCGAYGRAGTFEGAMNALREEGARRGADYVELVSSTEPHSEHGCFDQTFKLKGLAYKLRNANSAGAAQTPAVGPGSAQLAGAGECIPLCSPGYACRAGVCEPQCNPACPATQKCGPDRTCVSSATTSTGAH